MHKRDRYITIIGFLFPAVALYGIFFVFPMIQAFYISLFRWSGLSMHKEYVGLDNFRRLFLEKHDYGMMETAGQVLWGDSIFWMALKHNLTFMVVALIVIIPLALFFASVLARKVRGASTYRAVYLFPNMTSVVAVAVLWSFVYHPRFGILNSILESVGLERFAIGWLGEPNTALPAIIVTCIWYSLGFYIVLFLAGIQSIPPTFYEAAEIDGAGQWASFRHITIPLVWEILKLGIIYLVIHTINIFGLVWIMTEGGPSHHTEVLLTYLYRLAFVESNFGYATAVGVVTFMIIFMFSLIFIRLMRREVVEY